MKVGMSCKSLEAQTPEDKSLNYLAGAFLQVILFLRLDKRDERRGPAPRAAERGCNLQRLPASKAAGEAGHDLLLANPSQPRLDYLRRVGRFGFVGTPPRSALRGCVYALLQATCGIVRARSHCARESPAFALRICPAALMAIGNPPMRLRTLA